MLLSIAAEDEDAEVEGREFDLERVSVDDPRLLTHPSYDKGRRTPPLKHRREDRAWWKPKGASFNTVHFCFSYA